MQYMEEKHGRIKLGGYKGGRGYSGYHTTFYGQQVYLRSLQEFIYAKYLDFNKKYYKTENFTYEINGQKYKPDFFIYNENFERLEKIVEIKYTQEEKIEYIKNFSEYFNKIGIGYEVFSKDDIKEYIKKGIVKEKDLDIWRDNYVNHYAQFDYNGEKNPMYGVKHTEETKQKIGEKTIERFKDPVIRAKHKKSRELFWNSDEGKQAKEYYAKLRHQESVQKNPILEKTCEVCGKIFNIKLLTFKKRKYCVCSNRCSQLMAYRNGRIHNSNGPKMYKTRIINYFKIIKQQYIIDIKETNFDMLVAELKQKGIIPQHFGLSLSTIIKFFGSFDNLIKESI